MNKNIKLIALLSFMSLAGFAQVGIGTTTPDVSSALDITATDKGFLMPRMTTAQRTAIASPAEGLQAYDTDTKSVWTFDGATWKQSVGGTGKFVDGATPDIAYYEGKVGIGINNFSNVHQLYVKKEITAGQVTTTRIDGTYNGTGTSSATYALGAVAKNANTGTVGFAIATQGIIENTNVAGTINTAVGSWPQIYNNGNMDYAAALIAGNYNSGTITNAVGFSSEIVNNPGKQIDDATSNYLSITNDGNIDRASGLFLEYFGTGTVTDSYAVYIDNNFNKGTNDNFAIYSASDADSYLEGNLDVNSNLNVNGDLDIVGNLGVGIAAPLQKVHISGAMRLEPQVTAPTTGDLGDLYVNTDGNLYFHDGTSWRAVQLAP